MRRTFAGLTTALLVSYAVLNTGDAEGGRRRRACCAPQPTCCAPRATCCAPQATMCCPSTGCCGESPFRTTTYFCLGSTTPTFSFPGGGFYGGVQYSQDICDNLMHMGSPCSQPLTTAQVAAALRPIPQQCPCPNSNPSGTTPSACCITIESMMEGGPAKFSGMTKKYHYEEMTFEEEETRFPLAANHHIVGHTFVRFYRTAGNTSDVVLARLVVVKSTDSPGKPKIPIFYAFGVEIDSFPAAVEAQGPLLVPADGTGPIRTVHFGIDYKVVLAAP
jgi:hypothetical protein